MWVSMERIRLGLGKLRALEGCGRKEERGEGEGSKKVEGEGEGSKKEEGEGEGSRGFRP